MGGGLDGSAWLPTRGPPTRHKERASFDGYTKQQRHKLGIQRKPALEDVLADASLGPGFCHLPRCQDPESLLDCRLPVEDHQDRETSDAPGLPGSGALLAPEAAPLRFGVGGDP